MVPHCGHTGLAVVIAVIVFTSVEVVVVINMPACLLA